VAAGAGPDLAALCRWPPAQRAITIQYLVWCAEQAASQPDITRLVLFWENASWHPSRLVRDAVRTHNQQVQRSGQGVLLTPCLLPSKSPWLNPMEPKWLHAKRQIVEPERVLSLSEIAERVCQALHCPHVDHLSFPNVVAC
jgi:hypothetical protein